jgi:hypothetical protein
LVSAQPPSADDFLHGEEIRVWRTISAVPDPAYTGSVILVQECEGAWVLGRDGKVSWSPWEAGRKGPVASRTVRRTLGKDSRLTQSLRESGMVLA